jgi:hypothetical protein
MSSELPSSIIAAISFIGRSSGLVKTLGGFRKGHHSLPDAVNATTNAFLGKICADELATQAESLFQEIRAGLAYKRKELSLSVTSPTALFAAKEFSLEITYALEERDPSHYTVVTRLRDLRNAELARTAEFSGVFSGRFSEIAFELKKGARVESVIDAIEALDGEGGVAVNYPSDYHECVISVAEVDAQVRCSGSSLEMIFPRGGSPAELIDAFAMVRGAFQISRTLAGLIS